MKKMMLVLAAALGLGALAGCGSSEECSAFSTVMSDKCTSAQACCTSSQCRYVVQPGDKEFKCDGTTCTSAATMLVNYCNGQ